MGDGGTPDAITASSSETMVQRGEGSGASGAFLFAGTLLTPLRVVTAWMFLSAFLRRVVLAPAKHDPDSAAYLGAKFNSFLPNALPPVRSIIEFFVSHADLLYWKLWVFTIIEGLVGLALLLGVVTRLAALGVVLLAAGILAGAGWLGSTCVDEWQIGVLCIAGGLVVMFAGGGRISVDAWWQRRFPAVGGKSWAQLIATPVYAGTGAVAAIPKWAGVGAVACLVITLATAQIFHGGLWGPLHNLSVRPNVELSDGVFGSNGSVTVTVFRTEGPDVYGSFMVEAALKAPDGSNVWTMDEHDLAKMDPDDIKNAYIAEVRPGERSLIVPLGAKARVCLGGGADRNLLRDFVSTDGYEFVLTDVSGKQWSTPLIHEERVVE